MQGTLNKSFECLDLSLESIEEVRELRGILARIENRNPLVMKILESLRAADKLPMEGLYSGTIKRSH